MEASADPEFDPPVRSRGISRSNLATFLKSPELIKQFEDLTNDVAQVLPAAVSEAAKSADDANTGVMLVLQAAASAQANADRVEIMVRQLFELTQSQRDPRAEILRLQQRIEQLENLVHALRRGVGMDALRKQIDELQTLILGA